MSQQLSLLTLAAIAAVASTACSEAVPPASEGGYIVEFITPNTLGKTCAVTNDFVHSGEVGYADSKEIRSLLKDTVRGAIIQCAVTPNGAGFTAAGILDNGAGHHLDFKIDSVTAGMPAQGTIGFRSAKTVNTYRSPSGKPCTFSFSAAQAPQLAAGRIWIDFKCSDVVDVSRDSACSIASGTVAMQNCDQ